MNTKKKDFFKLCYDSVAGLGIVAGERSAYPLVGKVESIGEPMILTSLEEIASRAPKKANAYLLGKSHDLTDLHNNTLIPIHYFNLSDRTLSLSHPDFFNLRT